MLKWLAPLLLLCLVAGAYGLWTRLGQRISMVRVTGSLDAHEQAQIQQAVSQFADAGLLRSYRLETDPNWLSRRQRLDERSLMLAKLDTERRLILQEFSKMAADDVRGLTAAERSQVQLARWQRALELYVYSPPYGEDEDEEERVRRQQQEQSKELELLGLLEKLLTGTAEVR